MKAPKWLHGGRNHKGCLNCGGWSDYLTQRMTVGPGFGYVQLSYGKKHVKTWMDLVTVRTVTSWIGVGAPFPYRRAYRLHICGPLSEATYRWDWGTNKWWLESTGMGFA